MKLNEVAFVRTGLVLNRKEAKETDQKQFKYKHLTLRSVTNNGSINEEFLEEFVSKEILKDDYLTQENDIVVKLVHPYTSVLIDEKTKGTIVSSHFVIIRCDLTKILPEYLQVILDSTKVHKKIAISNISSTLRVIRPSFFSELDINIIPLEKQKLIGKINGLYKKEIDLLEKLKLEKQRCHSLFINKIQIETERK